MRRLIELLDQKNHYLEKFYSVNEEHLVQFLKRQFDEINYFYETRENILEILKYIDQEIKIMSHSEIEETMVQVEQIKERLAVKDVFVKRIIQQDIDILACIEAEKNSIIQELKEVKKGQKVVNAYKIPSFNEEL